MIDIFEYIITTMVKVISLGNSITGFLTLLITVIVIVSAIYGIYYLSRKK